MLEQATVRPNCNVFGLLPVGLPSQPCSSRVKVYHAWRGHHATHGVFALIHDTGQYEKFVMTGHIVSSGHENMFVKADHSLYKKFVVLMRHLAVLKNRSLARIEKIILNV